ncbi:hypothetical protein [Rhizobium herbae]|uniref:hypothetical protein n=1 Tax=Rhizobium herbae TaxID=508661 RepID=UPI0032080B45
MTHARHANDGRSGRSRHKFPALDHHLHEGVRRQNGRLIAVLDNEKARSCALRSDIQSFAGDDRHGFSVFQKCFDQGTWAAIVRFPHGAGKADAESGIEPLADFNKLHGQKLIALPGVRQTRTFFVMKEVKENARLPF